MVRTAFVTLSVAAVLAAVGAVMHGSAALPPDLATAGAAATASTTAPTASTSTPESPGTDGTMLAVGEETSVDAEPTTFTIAELHAGEVSAARFAAFWDAEVERIRTAPCPAPTAPGTTVVVATVGATPPGHLGDDYVDYAPVVDDARAEAAAACA